jgi:hypothetical protein
VEYIRNRDGEVIQSSRNLAGIRRYVGKHIIKQLDIFPLGSGEGQLSILFESGNSFQTNFVSYTVLKEFVRNWRNCYGCPFSIGGEDKGKLAFDNPNLIKVFEIYPCGDSFSKAWDASEDVSETTAIFRGDLSYSYNRRQLVAYLKRTYPGCIVRNRY